MGEDPGQERARALEDDSEKTAAQLRAEIEDVREELGETAAALAAKTDVKARAHEKVDELKGSVAEKKDELFAKAGKAAPGGGNGGATSTGSAGPNALEKFKRTARENPVPTAALGALVGGFLLGRLTAHGD